MKSLSLALVIRFAKLFTKRQFQFLSRTYTEASHKWKDAKGSCEYSFKPSRLNLFIVGCRDCTLNVRTFGWHKR
jgi:hypothetical protein